MLGMRVADDGSLLYLKRGRPPAAQEGYYVDPTDPFVHHPILPECKFRSEGIIEVPCCKDQRRVFLICGKGFPVSKIQCEGCVAKNQHL